MDGIVGLPEQLELPQGLDTLVALRVEELLLEVAHEVT
jgi:hypothetical protein